MRRLDAYPPYRAPHAGAGKDLSVEAAQANLDYLLAHRTERLAIITRYLEDAGVDTAGIAPPADCKPLLRAIHQWAAREWPSLYDPNIAKTEVWLASSRSGPEIVYSLLIDVAILFGELITSRRSRFIWSLDLDPDNEADGMISYRRPVVQIPKGGPFPAPIICDVEHVVVHGYFHCRSSLFGRIDELTRIVSETISGAHEAYWLQSAPAAKPDDAAG